MEKNNFETGNQNNQNRNNGNFNPMNPNSQNRNNGNFNPMNQNNQNRNNGNFNPMNQNNQNRNNGNFNPMNQNNQNRNNGNFNPMNQNNQNRNNGNFNPTNQNSQNQNYNNMNQNQNSYNHNSSNYNNMNPNQNNQNNNFNNQKPFLDSILEKDNPQNKLFLKLMFWISTVVFGLVAWITIKGIMIYMQFLNLQKEGFSLLNSSGDMGMQKLVAFGGKLAATSLEIFSIRNILKYIFIVLIVILILIFLKLRKINNLSKFVNINYLSVIIFCIAGIAEIKYTDFIDKFAGSLLSLEEGDSSALSNILNNAPDIFMIKICFIVLLVFSLIAVVTNFFLIFRNKKFEMQDIQREFRTMKNKVMKNNNNNYNQNNNNNNNYNNENWNNNTNNDYNNQNYR